MIICFTNFYLMPPIQVMHLQQRHFSAIIFVGKTHSKYSFKKNDNHYRGSVISSSTACTFTKRISGDQTYVESGFNIRGLTYHNIDSNEHAIKFKISSSLFFIEANESIANEAIKIDNTIMFVRWPASIKVILFKFIYFPLYRLKSSLQILLISESFSLLKSLRLCLMDHQLVLSH